MLQQTLDGMHLGMRRAQPSPVSYPRLKTTFSLACITHRRALQDSDGQMAFRCTDLIFQEAKERLSSYPYLTLHNIHYAY